MCQMTNFKTSHGTYRVAKHKSRCLANIVSLANNQDFISRVILFGSATTNKCGKESDIDIAVFGDVSKNKMLKSKKYKALLSDIRNFDKEQSYDVLYFAQSDYNRMSGGIKESIEQGLVLFQREVIA